MATSGIYTYSINRDTLVTSAFRALGVFNDDAPAPATDNANAVQALNLMIKQWHQEGCPLWTVASVQVPVSVGQTTYSIGPGGIVNTFRPLRVLAARLYYPSSGLDVQLQPLSRQEYDMIGNKSIGGTPNSYYYSPLLGTGNLHVYLPAGTGAALTGAIIKLTCQRPLMDMSNPTDDFDFPIEALNAIKWGLASELGPEYDIPMQKQQMIDNKADRLKQQLFDGSVEEASAFFTPNLTFR